MKTTSLTNNSRSHTFALTFWTLMVSLGLFMASPIVASAQELFILSTESGLELYQVEKLRDPDWLIPDYHSTYQPASTDFGIVGNSLMVQSGLQTTPHGRIYTMASRVDSLPTPKMDSLIKDLVTVKRPDRNHWGLAKESLVLRFDEPVLSSPSK
jgi:hypothetical protein